FDIGEQLLNPATSQILADWNLWGQTLLANESVNLVLTLKCNTNESFSAAEVITAESFKLNLEQAVVGTVGDDKFLYEEENGKYYINQVPAEKAEDNGKIIIPAVLKEQDESYIKVHGITSATIEEEIEFDNGEDSRTETIYLYGGVLNLDTYETVELANGLVDLSYNYPFYVEYTEVNYDYGVYDIYEGTYSMHELILPGTVQLTSEAFAKYGNNTCMENLETVTIKNGIKEIPDSIFDANYTGQIPLTTVNLPNTLKTIDDYAFYCASLTSITIPSSVTSIGNSAFSDCTSLTSVNIGNGVTSIDQYAFYCCESLPSITIPSSVTSIGDDAFDYCTSLTSVTIENGVTSIGNSTFNDCTSLTSITIPSSVTSIGDNIFYGCTSLTSVTIENGVTSIGDSTFYECESLTSITIPSSVRSIDYDAFYGTPFLTNLQENSNGVYTCSDGKKIVISVPTSFSGAFDTTNVVCIAVSAFSDCTSLTSITIPSSVTNISDSAFSGCTSLTSITIPSSVTSIGSYAFSGCESLTSITIPSSVTSIGGSAFSGCESLTSITIPSSVTSIGGSAFSGCTSLTSITIPSSVTSIGGSAFSGCTSLTSITIPSSVTSIGSRAFSGCNQLTSVEFKNINGWRASISSHVKPTDTAVTIKDASSSENLQYNANLLRNTYVSRNLARFN
ncbi:MAG: leucine-rich repeat domain-containing protein, partial [Clostridiales bacterium]|nr:leucine-rich repeat domain-containing protein [Clostridiales bacterium]